MNSPGRDLLAMRKKPLAPQETAAHAKQEKLAHFEPWRQAKILQADVTKKKKQIETNTNRATNLEEAIARQQAELDQTKANEIANQIDVQIWENVHSLTTYQRPDLKATKEALVNWGAIGFASVDYADIGFKAGATSTP